MAGRNSAPGARLQDDLTAVAALRGFAERLCGGRLEGDRIVAQALKLGGRECPVDGLFAFVVDQAALAAAWSGLGSLNGVKSRAAYIMRIDMGLPAETVARRLRTDRAEAQRLWEVASVADAHVRREATRH